MFTCNLRDAQVCMQRAWNFTDAGLHESVILHVNYLEFFRINIYDIKLRPYTNIVMLLLYLTNLYLCYNRACLERLF